MNYNSLENLDLWVVEAQKAMQRLSECLIEIQQIRTAQKKNLVEKSKEEKRLKDFAAACHNAMGRVKKRNE